MRENRRAISALCLALFTIVIYNSVTNNGFVSFDDTYYVIQNKHIQAGLNWRTISWAFRSMYCSNWHPLTWMSHALDWQLFGNHASGHHYVSVLLHALCAVLLFIFLENATKRIWPSLTVAVLFTVHPINVESVAWIAERKNVLSTVFFLLTLIAYESYVRSPSLKRYVLVAFCFVLGLMSKPMVITLPFVLLLLDYWPLRRAKTDDPGAMRGVKTHFGFLVIEKIPLFIFSIASGILTVIAQRNAAIKTQYSFSERFGNAVVSYCLYIGKAFWPSKLAVLYPHPINSLAAWRVLASLALLSLITAIVVKFRSHRYLMVGWLWFLGTLVPVIGLIQVGEQAMADRYAYVPFIGLFIAIIWAAADFIESKKLPAAYCAVVALLVVTILSIRTRIQIHYWHDSAELWSHTLDVTENNFVALDSMGAELLSQGRITEAVDDFRKADQINPKDAFSQLDLGFCERQQGNITAAIEHFQSALHLPGDSNLYSTAFNNLGSIYRRAGNYALARENYQSALQLVPENVQALTGMALLEQKTNHLADAITYYSRAVAAGPSDLSYLLLGQALYKAGRVSEAQGALTTAQKISGDWQSTQLGAQRMLAE